MSLVEHRAEEGVNRVAILNNDWAALLDSEFEKPYYQKLRDQLKEEYQTRSVYPDMHEIFAALHLTPYQETKVVIIGQDPYHGQGQAHGLSFSVQPGIKVPPSLRNIYQELREDLGCETPEHGYLASWAEQGVMLLNTVLTVRAHEPNSHRGIGWEDFTDQVIAALNDRRQPVVFMLWGKHAQSKRDLITEGRHLVIQSAHPSPFSAHRGFFGSRPFSRANQFLTDNESPPIDWQLPLKVDS